MIQIYFACDAGMGSSALGASMLRKYLNQDIKVNHCSVYKIPSNCDIVIVQKHLASQVKEAHQYRKVYELLYFLDDKILREISKEINKMGNNEMLKKEAIILNCQSCTSDQAIVAMGELLQSHGYIEEPYIQGMLNRDHDLTTYLGNNLAIPHGEFDVKKYVLNTGIAVMIYPDGIDWNGNLVRIVIGIAAKGDDHMEILSNIAITLCEMETVNQIVSSDDVNFIQNILVEGA